MESLLCAKHCSTVENKVWARSSNISQSGWGGRSTHSGSHRRWRMVPEGYLENKTSKFEKMNEIPAGRWGGRLEVEAGPPPSLSLSLPAFRTPPSPQRGLSLLLMSPQVVLGRPEDPGKKGPRGLS